MIKGGGCPKSMNPFARHTIIAVAVLGTVFFQVGAAGSEEPEMINRPVGSSGLTGLLYTTTPFMLPQGTWEAGASVSTERNYRPEYSVTSYAFSISHGLSRSVETAVRSAYWTESESQVIEKRGAGDTEILVKWGIIPPKEYSMRPSVAAIAAVIAPSGDRNAGTHTVQHWGFRAGMSMGTELLLEDYVMGVYADGQMTIQDLSDESLRDWFHSVNAGVLLPVSKHRNLQMFLEYNRQKGKDAVTLRGNDYSAVTYGLRLVSVRFNLTIGTQFIHKYVDDHDDASRIMGMLSIKL